MASLFTFQLDLVLKNCFPTTTAAVMGFFLIQSRLFPKRALGVELVPVTAIFRIKSNQGPKIVNLFELFRERNDSSSSLGHSI